MENGINDLNKSLNLLARSAFIVLLAVLVSKILAYIYRIIIARNFGPDGYGIYSLAIMIVSWVITFAGLGLGQGIVRYISSYRGKNETEKIQSIFRSSSTLLIFTTIILGMLLFLFAEFISISIFNEPKLTIFLRVFAIAVPLTVFLNAFLRIIQAYEKIGWHAFISDFLLNFLKIIFLIFFIFLGLNLNAIVLSYILGILGAFIILLLVLRYQTPKIFRKSGIDLIAQSKLFKELLNYSWPLLFSRVLTDIFNWTDIFFIGIYKTVSDVGIYNAALPIAFLLTIPSMLFMRLFYPLINKEYSKKNNELVKELSKQVGKWIFILSLPLFVLMTLFPGVFINIFFGEEYIIAKNALRILSFGFLFSSVFSVSGTLLEMVGKTRIVMLDVLFSFSLNIILNITLIQKFGITGAAIATAISIVALYSILAFQSYIYTKIIPIRRKMIIAIIAALISAIFLLFLRNTIDSINLFFLIMFSLFFFILYILLILLFKGFDKNDIAVIRSSIKKLGTIKKFNNKKSGEIHNDHN